MTNSKNNSVVVIGGGLAGSEAAWQAAEAGCAVTLYEMRPVVATPAHHTSELAELVCSNSFGAEAPDRASGLIQQELQQLNSVVMATARDFRVPAGGALAVDRGVFSAAITRKLESHPRIDLRREELKALLPDQITVIATGPLTSAALAADLQRFTGTDYLNFFDAASPIVTGESINRNIAYLASRYDRGEAAYLNCPFTKEEYLTFWTELCAAEDAPLKDFDRLSSNFFEGCLPVEELARRGVETLRFGPLKPVGLRDERFPDQRAHAVVQLRMEDSLGQLWNMVGFQTNLRWGEQERVFRLIPGLEEAVFVRKGVMHRNTFLKSPDLLEPTLQFRAKPTLFAAGQITGTEGYISAVAGGWLAGTNAGRLVHGLSPLKLPKATMMGALFDYISTADSKHFQPMPPNFGIFSDPLDANLRGKRARAAKRAALAEIALREWRSAHM